MAVEQVFICTCDRCGAKVASQDALSTIKISGIESQNLPFHDTNRKSRGDLCPGCAWELNQWFQQGAHKRAVRRD
jgi:hypothetical protein